MMSFSTGGGGFPPSFLLQQLTCMGPLEHRLTVQATDDVYDRTKKLMKEAEEQRKEARWASFGENCWRLISVVSTGRFLKSWICGGWVGLL